MSRPRNLSFFGRQAFKLREQQIHLTLICRLRFQIKNSIYLLLFYLIYVSLTSFYFTLPNVHEPFIVVEFGF